MRFVRRLVQLFFLFLFIFLFLQARFPYNVWLPSDLILRFSPLIAVTTFLSSRSFDMGLVFGFLVLILTIPLGRFFCGWICPLGTTIDFSDKVLFRQRRFFKNSQVAKFHTWKYVLLIGIVVAALFSVQLVWLFDPLVILSRFLTVVFYPAFVFLCYYLFYGLFQIGFFENQIYTLYDWAQQSMLPVEQPHIINGLPIFLIFFGLLTLGLVSRRFWCRVFCPLGALFGLFSKFRLLKRKVDSSCTSCGLCDENCRMNAIAEDFISTNQIECIECGQCVAECPAHSISYRFAFGGLENRSKIDLSRRRMILAGIGGLSSALLLKTILVKTKNPGVVIRPPGAVDENLFLDKCVRCQACTRICASTGGCLQPCLTEAGWEGFWSPVVMPRLGYCEYNCTLCGQVCPTGAIQNLTLAQKQQLKIGRAFFDKDRCIPWRDFKDCLVCEEHCPLPEKAIKFDTREVRTNDGDVRTVKFPYVVPELCIGCGICETKCPVIGQPGIYLTSEGNERVKLIS